MQFVNSEQYKTNMAAVY